MSGEEELRGALRRLRQSAGAVESRPLAVTLLAHVAEMRRHADAMEDLLLGALAGAMIKGLSLDEVRTLAFEVGVNPDELGETLTEAVRRLLRLAEMHRLVLGLGKLYPHCLNWSYE